jgi:uncharacterized protein (DUF1501 family)
MLDPDISTADARRLLSRPHRLVRPGDDLAGPGGWTRRGFLQAVGMGLGAGAVAGTLGDALIPGDVHDAFASPPIAAGDGILVTINLYGGNDGLNTVVPYTDGHYYDQRSNVAIQPAQVLALDDRWGLHPRLPYLHQLYQRGQMAIVHGVGYANPDLSHFTSMAIWMHGRYGGSPTSGWVGRWLDGVSAERAELAAVTIDSSVALHMIGEQRRAVGISPWGDMFGVSSEAPELRMYDGLRAMAAPGSGRGAWHDMFAATMRTQLDLAHDVAPAFEQELPEGDLATKLTIAARLVNANIGMRIIDVGLDAFDTHAGQPTAHGDLLGQLDTAIATFYGALAPQWRDRVTLMTLSEFGRTSWSNESLGTDHGTSAPLFVIGTRVRGGMYGQAPSLAGLGQWDRMPAYVDFRWVLGSVLDGWMGGGGHTVLNGNFENLQLFAGTPGTAGGELPAVVLPPAAPSGFVAAVPTRVFDTRDGTGGRTTPLGQGETWRFPLAGTNGIPIGAVAVALNLTSVDATAGTYVTVSPSGELRPFASNLNPVPGAAIPNLVLARVGVGGSIDLYNNSGSVHLVGDVVGWFVPESGVGLEALAPARLLDTRDGTGDVLGPIGPGQTIELQVAGRGGVSGDCVAVALNVTATEPTSGSYLTVWPSGEQRPLASSVNMAPGQTVPNLVLAKVGAGGKVSIFNHAGSTHVVVDVLGCFGEGVPSKFVSLSPSRVLDTREGNGAAQEPLGRGALALALAGRGGVPSSGASAVLLNVTAVTPSTGTYVTVFPTGIERPTASNLNAVSGQVVPNMVIARLGGDGAAMIYNNSGTVDLVADVMGYFT